MNKGTVRLGFGVKEQVLPIQRTEADGIVKLVAGYISERNKFEFLCKTHPYFEDFSMKEFGIQIGEKLSKNTQSYGLILADCFPALTDRELEDLHDGIDSVLEKYE